MHNDRVGVLDKKIRCMVLMPYFNAPHFFRMQIESILSQLDENDIVLIGDDASNAEGKAVLMEYAKGHREKIVVIENTHQLGVTKNVFALISFAVRYQAKYIFLADQDDYWLPGRLESGASGICGREDPVLNISAAFVTDDGLRLKNRLIPLRSFSPAHFIFETPGPGMTYCFNRTFAKGVVEWGNDKVWPVHDNLIAAYASFFATITYDDTPRVLYVQHSSNQLGFRMGLSRFSHRRTRVGRLLKLANMRYALAREDFKLRNADIFFRRFRQSWLDDVLLKLFLGVGHALQHRNRD
jgi:glycosyltransferase involved in cell wall biosynthesis